MYFKKIDAFIMSLDNKASVGTCTCICKITIISFQIVIIKT